MKKILINYLVMFSTTSASEMPIMLSPVEFEAIGLAIDQAKSLPPDRRSELPRLEGIFFKNEQEWVIWLNGQVYYPQQNCSWYKILKVSAQTVTIECLQEDNKVIQLRVQI